MIFKRNYQKLSWSRNATGLAIFFVQRRVHEKAIQGTADQWALDAYDQMLRLLECGDAGVAEVEDGIFLSSYDAVRLDEELREQFELPPPWPGCFRLETGSLPNVNNFDAALRVLDERQHVISTWSLDGPILVVTNREFYLPTAAQYACLYAFQQWQEKGKKTEVDHLRLLHTMSEAAEHGCRIDLRAAPDIDVRTGGECFVEAIEQCDGSLELTPIFSSLIDGGEQDPAEIRKAISARLHHLEGDSPEAIVRVGKKIVLLDDQQTAQARAVSRRRVVPKEQRDAFRRDPAAWLADHVFEHGAVEFLPRVLGIGEWQGGYLGGGGELGDPVDWFDRQPEADPVEKPDITTPEEGGESGHEDEDEDDEVEVEDEEPRGPLVPLIELNDDQLGWGIPFGAEDTSETADLNLEFDEFPRQPFPHQIEAIRWLSGHTSRAGPFAHWQPDAHGWGAGALLADDMGLGKTFSTLLHIGRWHDALRLSTGSEPPACLVVAPLSLVENWAEEVKISFPEGKSPFSRVVQAIPAADLKRFYATQNGRDLVSVADGEPEVEKYGLKFGDRTEASLDFPGTIVITTYQTLREFRFSFAGCEWGSAIFDEAQNIKNPNALQTVAAKSLKAFFRVALTGTPVENHLGDLWSLMDAIEPGALGSFSDFRKNWIRRFGSDPEERQRVGAELRTYLSRLILRRTKEESLLGLPSKMIQAAKIDMSLEQVELYDEVLDLVKRPASDDSGKERTNRFLACMWELRRITLHPDLAGGGSAKPVSTAHASRQYFERSGKLRWLLDTIDAIKQKGEKVLIFSVQKRLQAMLVAHLGKIYETRIPLINGDTKASSRTAPNETRLGLIKQFCERQGFGICVLSPIAAGAGLNIVAANHVIHLERHWNPAKEDQATDRAYRIGQKKDVHVHLPILVHPVRENLTTFDMGLNMLISQKRDLAGSLGLIPVSQVSTDELFAAVFAEGSDNEKRATAPKRLTIDDVDDLSWEFFEALIAILYEFDSAEVILTPRGRDSGADVIALGCGDLKVNMMIQCKQTKNDTLDSEHAVREVVGATPLHQACLGKELSQGIVHTNASRFSKRTKRAARHCSVELRGRAWLKKQLQAHLVTRGAIVERNARRKKVI